MPVDIEKDNIWVNKLAGKHILFVHDIESTYYIIKNYLFILNEMVKWCQY